MKLLLVAAASAGAVLVGGAPGAEGGTGAPGTLAWPVTGALLTQGFGCTSVMIEAADPACPSGHFHSGLDLAAPAGTQVRAAAAGRARVLWNPTGYGLYVLVDLGAGLQTLYGHLSAASIEDGAQVQAGAEIGRVGSTGLSTGPHLHFEVRRDGRAVDPGPLLSAGR
ncbi:MAG: M23 family metallopeptidase [Candidatus Dormibacteraeota bacterium]|nr:M23 family metallopeptidase [Candidatus Dormibacteraeota bacterium]